MFTLSWSELVLRFRTANLVNSADRISAVVSGTSLYFKQGCDGIVCNRGKLRFSHSERFEDGRVGNNGTRVEIAALKRARCNFIVRCSDDIVAASSRECLSKERLSLRLTKPEPFPNAFPSCFVERE